MKLWQTAILIWLMLSGTALAQQGTRNFSVTTYGAVADDGNSDTTAIQKAIEAAEDFAAANSTRATVFFPKGSYHITNLEIDRPNITLDGYDARLEALSGSGFNQMLLVTGEADSETAEYIVIKGLTIDGNYPTINNAGTGLGVNVRANHVKLLDVTVEATETDTFTSQFCQDVTFERCISRTAGETGFRIRSDYTKILDCEVYDWNALDASAGNRAVLVDSVEMDAEDFVIKGFKAEMNQVRNVAQVMLIDSGDGAATEDGTLPFANSGVATNNAGRASWKLDVGHGFMPGDGILISGTGRSEYDDISHRIYSVDGNCFIGVVDANTFKLYDTASNAVTNGATGRYNVTGNGTGDFYVKSAGGRKKLFTVADQSADTFTCTSHGFKTGMPARLTVGTSSHVLPAGLTGVATVTVNTAYAAAGTSGDYVRPKRINNVTLDDIQILHQAPDTSDSSVIKINNVNNLAITRLRVTQTPPTGVLEDHALHLGGGLRKVTIDESILPNGISNNVRSWIPELTITKSEIGSHSTRPTDALENLQVGKLTLDGNTIRFSNAAIETADTASALRDADIDQWKIINNVFDGKSATSTSVICIRINNESSNLVSSGKVVWYNNVRRNPDYTGLTFTAATTDIISATGHNLVTGDQVTVSTSGTLPTGLSASTNYFVRRTGDGVLTLHTTLTGASDDTARVDITGTGSGTHKLLGENVGCLFTGTASGGHYFGTDSRCRLFYQRGIRGNEFEAATVPSDTTIAYTKGDIIWQMNPVPGGSLGWLCTKTGVPGSSAGEFQAMPGTPKTYNVVNYGARPDDAIEDTTAIQAAIDAAEADAPAIVYFPPGDYESVRVVLDDDDVTIIAYGAVLNQYASLGVTDGACMLRITGDRNRVYGLEINGGGQNTAQFASASANRGIQVNGGEHNFVKDCYVHDTSKYLDGTLSPGTGSGQLDHEDNVSQGADCFQVVLGNYNAFVNCISANSGWNAFRSSGNGNRFEGCHGTNYLGNGIRFNSGESGLVTSCVLTADGITTRSGILVDPEVGDLFGSIVIRDTRVYLNSVDGVMNSPNVLKIARTRYCVIDGGDYEIGPDNADSDQGIRLEDTIEQCVIQNLRTDAILMTNTLFQGLTTSHASAASGTQTTITVDATSLNADTDLDEVSELLSDGKTVFISGCSIPAYNGMHDVDTANVALGTVTFTIDTPYVAGTWGTAIAHNTTDRLTVRNVQFGHGVHNTIGPMEHIKGRIVEIEECEFDLRDNDSDDSTGSVTGIEWSVPDDRSFTLFRLVNNKARFYKNGGANGKLLDMEERTTTLLTSGKTIGYGNIVEAGVTGAGTPLVVVTTGNANRLMLFTTRGENTRSFAGTAAPTAGTWSAGDLVFNTGGSSQGALFWRCASAGTPGTWEAITPTIRGMLDANLGSITNGQGIAWNSSTNKFDPVTISGGTAVTTPDGLTTATTTDKYNVKHYDASGSGTDYYVTTSTSGTTTATTRTSAGVATSHDFVAGQGVALLGAGASCGVSAPVLTFGGQASSYATAAGTAYTWTFNDLTDVITVNSAPPVAANGAPVRVTTDGVLPTGISAGTTYYLRIATATTFTFHTSSAGAIDNTGLVTLTGGSGTHTIVGYTEYRYTVRGGDGKGGWSAASSEITVFNWEFNGTNANYNQCRFHVPSLSHSLAIYGRGTSSRKLMTIMESRAIRSDGVEVDPSAFTASESSGGSTKLLFTVPTGHGIVANDVVYANFLSSGDTGFSGQFLVESVTATTITCVAGTWNAGMGTPSAATGYLEAAYVEWRDYGDNVAINDVNRMRLVENPNSDWRANQKYTRGDYVIDTAGDRLWRLLACEPDAVSNSSEPTWTATANALITDNDLTWKRDPAWVPTEDTSGAMRQMLLTTVATVPTASTFTTTDAAGADISSNTLACMHNDALAIRAARDAIATDGIGGTLYFPSGTYNCILPDFSDSNYWDNSLSAAQPRYVFLFLTNDSDQRLPYGISVECDPATQIRTLMSSSTVRADAMSGTMSYQPLMFFIGAGANRCNIIGGNWTWDHFSGGFARHNSISATQTGSCWMVQLNGNGLTADVEPYDMLIRGARVHWPSIFEANGITNDDNVSAANWKIENTWLCYGGCDANQVGLPHGDFEFTGGGIVMEWLLGSHGFYLNVGHNRLNLHHFTMRFVGTGGNSANAISARGTTSDRPLRDLILDSIIFDRTIGNVRIGDSSTSNRIVGVVINNLIGRPDLRFAEARHVSVTGGDYGTITFDEDVEDVKFSNLTCNVLDITPTDIATNVQCSNLTVRCQVLAAATKDLSIRGLAMKNPFGFTTNLVGGTYEWIQISGDRYYVRLRATGGDPGLSAPDGLYMRDKYLTQTQGTLASLAVGEWAYGYPDGLGGAGIPYQTICVNLDDDDPDPDNWPYGSVQTITVSTSTIGIRFIGYNENFTIDKLNLTSDWADVDALISASGCSFGGTSSISGIVAQDGLSSSATQAYLMDFSNTALSRCDWLRFDKCTLRQGPLTSTSRDRHAIRINLARGGRAGFYDCDLRYFGSSPVLTGCVGNFDVVNCEVQSNVLTMTVLASADTWIENSSSPNLFDTDGQPVLVKSGTASSSFPTTTPQVAVGTVYWYRNADSKLYTSRINASTGTSPITVDTDGTVEMTVLDAARTNLLTGYEALGDATHVDAYGEVRDNKFRGNIPTYPQITSNQSDYQLWPIYNVHRLSTDASREIDGFNAPAAGTRVIRVRLFNCGSFDIVLKDDTDIGSVDQNRIACHTNADITISAGESIELEYDMISQFWRTIGN